MTTAPSPKPTVSLVICTRNRAEQLAAMLDWVERLDARHLLEVVIVNNGSSDSTAAVLEAYQRRSALSVQVVMEPRRGLSNARNAGIRASVGPIIAFTDDDCYPQPDFIEKVHALFHAEPVDIISGPMIQHDPADHWVATSVDRVSEYFRPGTVITPGMIHGGCMAFRRSVFATSGLFDPDLGAGTPFPCEDTEMVARACLDGHAVRFSVEPVVRHHHRRKQREGEALVRSYAYGRGAYWIKMLAAYPGRRGLLLKHWFWTLRSALVWRRWRGFRECVYEAAGAAHYLMGRPRVALRAQLASRRPPVGQAGSSQSV